MSQQFSIPDASKNIILHGIVAKYIRASIEELMETGNRSQVDGIKTGELKS
jgi:hypothetical protein